MMKYKNLEGEEVKWRPKNSPRENASKIHQEAIKIVKELIPGALVYEECCLPLGIKKTLYLDILIPDFNLAIEVDGKQHDEYISYFHKEKQSFANQKKNDVLKESWCEANNIILLRFKEKDGSEFWRDSLVHYRKSRETK
jgi:hypothetical protein